MRGKAKWFAGLWALVCSLHLAWGADAVREGEIQLSDGSLLHGGLFSASTKDGLAWNHPASKASLRFKPEAVGLLRFAQATGQPTNFNPGTRVRFKNGDEILGNLKSLENGKMVIETWFGGLLTAPEDVVEAIGFSSRGFHVLYQGPTSMEGWKTGRNPRPWKYQDGAFVARGPDILGRDFGLKGSSTLSFNLAWDAPFSLSVTLYAQQVDRFDFSTSGYVAYLRQGAISLQKNTPGQGAVLLGNAAIPSMLKKSRTQFEFRSNVEEATISLYADGAYLARWKDPAGFVAKGTGFVFYSQTDGAEIKLSDIRVTELDGRYDPEPMLADTNGEDIVFLANQDRVRGKVEGLSGGKFSIKTKVTQLNIPLERVVQVVLGGKSTNAAPATSVWSVRASFGGGEAVAFDIEKWADGIISGVSPIFGPVKFRSDSVRLVQFRSTTTGAAADDFEAAQMEPLDTDP